jgi:hypothetical protein
MGGDGKDDQGQQAQQGECGVRGRDPQAQDPRLAALVLASLVLATTLLEGERHIVNRRSEGRSVQPFE